MAKKKQRSTAGLEDYLITLRKGWNNQDIVVTLLVSDWGVELVNCTGRRFHRAYSDVDADDDAPSASPEDAKQERDTGASYIQ